MLSRSTYNMRTFYIIVLSQTFSMIGSRISSLAIGIWVYRQTGNATPLALVAFFTLLPQILASSISGVLADRWNRRTIIILADAAQAVGTFLLFLIFLTDSFQLWHLYAISFMSAIFSVFQGPAFMASVTMLVPDEKRDRANAIQQLMSPAALIFAPAMAGFIYALVNVEGALIVDLVTFIVAVIVVMNIHIPQPERTKEGKAAQGSIWQEMLGGIQYLWTRKTLLILMLHASLINFLFTGAMVVATPYLLSRTDSEPAMGFIVSASSVGAIVGGVLFGLWGGTRPRINTILPGVILAGGFLALIGTSQATLTLAATFFLMMLPLPMVNAAMMSMMQIKVPPDLQGRVFAVMGQVSLLLSPLATLLVGPLVDNLLEPAVGKAGWATVAPLVGSSAGAGMGLLYFGAGILSVISSLIIYAQPAIRQMESHLPDYVPDSSEEKAAEGEETPSDISASPVPAV